MRHCTLIFLMSILFIGNAVSQVRRVNIDTHGNFEIIMQVGNGVVVLSDAGEILETNLRGNIEYHTSFSDSFLNGKIISIGNTRIRYHTSFVDSYLNGKIIEIGGTRIRYHTSFVDSYLNGRVIEIGGTRIRYHTSFVDSYLNGKIIEIGNTKFEYHTSLMNSHLNGMLKSGNRVVNSNGIRFFLIEDY